MSDRKVIRVIPVTEKITVSVEDYSDWPKFPPVGYVPIVSGHRGFTVYENLEQAILAGIVVQFDGFGSHFAGYVIRAMNGMTEDAKL